MPFKKMTDADTDVVMELLNRNKLANIGQISTIRLLGMNGEDYAVYGEYVDDTLAAVIALYKNLGAGYYAESTRDISEAVELLKSLPWVYFQGRKHLIQPFVPYLDHRMTDETQLAVTSLYDDWAVNDTELTTMTTEEELQECMDVTFQIEEFEKTRNTSKEEMIAEMKDNYFRIKDGMMVYLRKEGRIVATARTICETDDHAMVQAVATLPEERRKGYATTIIQYLMNVYKKKNKHLCLTFNNPEAARIYHRLGFVDQDDFMALLR